MQREIEADAVPQVQHGQRVDLGGGCRGCRFGRVRTQQRAIENGVDVELAVHHGHRAEDLRAVGAAAQPQVGVDVDGAELVGQHREAARACVDGELADAQFARAEAAGQRQRPSAGVFQPERLHGHAIRRELKRRCAVPVSDAGGGDEKRCVLDADRAGEARVACGADRPHVQLQHAAHFADRAGQRFDDAEADRAGRQRHVERAVRTRLVDDRERHDAGGGQPDARRLVEAQIQAEILIAVIDAPGQPLVAQAPDAALGDVDERHHGRACGRSAHLRVEVQPAAVHGRTAGRSGEGLEEHAPRRHVQRAAAVLTPRAADRHALRSADRVDERHRRDGDGFGVPAD